MVCSKRGGGQLELTYGSQMCYLLVCSSRLRGVFVHKCMLHLHITKLYVRTAGSSRHNGAFMAASEFTDAEKKKKRFSPREHGVAA